MSPDSASPPQGHVVRKQLSLLLRNPVGSAGVALALVSLANFFLLFFIDLISAKPSPYIGILAYMVAPAFLICGLAMMVVGLVWERRRKIDETGDAHRYPRIDLNDPNQRSAV